MKITALMLAAAMVFAVTIAVAEDEGPKTAFYPSDIVYTGTGIPVVFSHDFHVGGLGFTCDVCHTEIFELDAFAAREKGDFKMRVMQDGDYCGKCHDGETAFSSGEYESCGRCHSGAEGAKVIPGLKVIGPEEEITLGFGETAARFLHSSHSGFKCLKCHTAIFPIKKTDTVTSMEEIDSGKSCGLCHNGAVAFDATNCSLCHPSM